MRKVIPDSDRLSDYLRETEIMDFSALEIRELSERLKREANGRIDFMKRIYEFVRDEISHSSDIDGKIVTLKASDVLKEKQGICFAKSHLLAALYCLNGIPAGVCYQKLMSDEAPDLVLHGLCGIYIQEETGNSSRVRLDARGNKPGVCAQFSLSPETEKLAFIPRPDCGEEDFSKVYADPAPEVIQALTENRTLEELNRRLSTGVYGVCSENDRLKNL